MTRIHESEWIWLPYHGHLIVADQCALSLHTHIGIWCVSSIGWWTPRHGDLPEEIGAGRFWETFLNRLRDSNDPADHIEEFEVDSISKKGNELYWDMAESIRVAHMKMCQKAASKEENT